MKILSKIFLIVFFSWFITGCEDKILPSLDGDMIGYIFTFDEFGNLLKNHDGVRVTAIGSKDTYSALTNATGHFLLRGLPIDTYELHFEKEGYGTLKQFGVKHLGGQPTILGLQDDRVFFIYELPKTSITNIVLEKDTAYAEFQISNSPAPEYINVELYFSDSPDFTATANKFTKNFKFGVNGPNWNYWTTQDMPYSSGSIVYYKAAINTKIQYVYRNDNYLIHFANYYYRLSGISTYFDTNQKKTINPNLGNETEVYSFTFPD